jgi:hypothetical protein
VKIDGRTSLGRQDQLGQNQRKTPEIHFLTLLMRIEMKFHFKTESSNPKSAILRKRPISKHFKAFQRKSFANSPVQIRAVQASQTQSNPVKPNATTPPPPGKEIGKEMACPPKIIVRSAFPTSQCFRWIAQEMLSTKEGKLFG